MGEKNVVSDIRGESERTEAEISSLIQASAKNNDEIAKLQQTLSEAAHAEEALELKTSDLKKSLGDQDEQIKTYEQEIEELKKAL